MSDLDAWVPPVFDPDSKLEARARMFHANNPYVLDQAEMMAAEALAVLPVVGMKMLWERMRWYYAIDTKEELCDPSTGKPFKLNNNHHAYYARWLLVRNPTWMGRIRVRRTGGGGHVS